MGQIVNYWGMWLVVSGSILSIVVWTLYFFIKEYNFIESNLKKITREKYDWLIFPARICNEVYIKIFGKASKDFFETISWRSSLLILLISIIVNVTCIIYILGQAPDDLPMMSLEQVDFLLKILYFLTLLVICFL